MYPPLYSPSSSLHTSRHMVFLCVTHTLVTESLLFSHSTLFTHCRILSEDCVLCAQSCIRRLCPVLSLLLHSVPICHTSLYTVGSSCLTLYSACYLLHFPSLHPIFYTHTLSPLTRVFSVFHSPFVLFSLLSILSLYSFPTVHALSTRYSLYVMLQQPCYHPLSILFNPCSQASFCKLHTVLLFPPRHSDCAFKYQRQAVQAVALGGFLFPQTVALLLLLKVALTKFLSF